LCERLHDRPQAQCQKRDLGERSYEGKRRPAEIECR